MLFRNRFEAGRILAEKLSHHAGTERLIVLALPRGGVPVAFDIANKLRAPLDVFVVRKLGTPGQEELAMGAIASGGIRVMNESIVKSLNIPRSAIESVVARESTEIQRRERLYRKNTEPLDLTGRTVLLVDDGLATGATMRAAIAAVKTCAPEKIIVAVPVADSDVAATLASEVDELVCAATPHPLQGVGRWFDDFTQTSDEQVSLLLAKAEKSRVDAA